jgi:symplekin
LQGPAGHEPHFTLAMANSAELSVSDQIRQLEGVRKLVLGEVNVYPQVIPVALDLFRPHADVRLRRWGVDFLSECFASPAVPLGQKETMALQVFDTLKQLVENPKQDVLVLRSVIQTAASVYPLAMKWM